ncbi:hypothetical protein HKX48_004188 [Thoreauomyces humboldtii]|nr:hypothetical protein HKX48_004188 [Thoreauomyces humboldtii]
MLDYSWEKKAYCVWDVAGRQVIETGDVDFDEGTALATTPLKLISLDNMWSIEAIVDKRPAGTGSLPQVEYHVKWLDVEEFTWEPLSVVKDTAALRIWRARHNPVALFTALRIETGPSVPTSFTLLSSPTD